MTKKGSLFSLIKSLSKSEKRYFKLFASANGNKNYLLLFNFIDKQTEYDEEAVRTHFKDKKFAMQLHVTKNYLASLILKSLRNYYTKISKAAELKDLLRDIEILFTKELYDQCHYAIEKALAIAKRYERQHDMLEIYGWKRRLLLERLGREKSQEPINEILEHEKDALQKLASLNEYWSLTINFFEMLNDNSAGPDLLATHPLLKSAEHAATFQARVLYHHILYVKNMVTDNLPEAEHQISDLINYIEQRPEFIKQDPSSYITAISNKIGICLFTKNLRSVPKLLSKIKAIPATYGLKEQSPVTIKLLLRTFNLELELYRDTGEIQRGIALVVEVKKFLEQWRGAIPADYKLLLQYQFAYLYYMNGDYKNSLYWIKEIIRTNFGTVREDIQSFTLLLNLIVHFELGNITVLKYAVDSCRRFLKKKRNLYRFERLLLSFFSRVSLADEKRHLSLFRKLHRDLFSVEEDPQITQGLDYLNFKGWIEQKLRDLTPE
ncbi:hypothetical protein MJD09_08800 [bacterium]|nr:hypothetical protein [bacterium]